MAVKAKESPAAFVPKARMHLSAILRAQTDEDRHRQMETLVEDLRKVARIVQQ